MKNNKKTSPMQPDRVSRAMAAVRGEHTTPEITLRKVLWRMGLRYRLHRPDLPGKPDIVFSLGKVAVFVDGDYWHGNQWRLRGFKSLEDQLKTVHNREYWERKIKRNIERDRKVNVQLRKAGWKVVRIWESDINRDPERAARKVARALAGRRQQ